MRMKTIGAAIAVMGLAVGTAAAQMQPTQSPTARGQNAAFCLEGADGAKNCGFATMAACDAAKKGQADTCAPNPASTTGSGAMSPGGATAPGGTPSGSPAR